MGLMKMIGDLLSGKTVSYNSSSSSSTHSSSHTSTGGGEADLPSPVRGKNSTTRSETRTHNGVSQQHRVSFTRYTIGPQDAVAWAGALQQTSPPPSLPDAPAAWWNIEPTARFFELGSIGDGEGFVAIAPDDSAVYVYQET